MGVDTTTLTVNGVRRVFSMGEAFGQVPYSETLLETLRDRLGLTAAKKACDGGACGCCTVIKDGEAVPSCSLLTVDCDGSDITTLEGLADKETGELSKVQQAFLDYNAFQCGFCTPGIIMTTTALLDKNPNPTQEEVRDALAGNYCRCISQYHVFEAIDSLTGRAKRSPHAHARIKSINVERAKALGGVAPVPLRREAAEAYLEGREPDAETAKAAAELALEGALPFEKNAYKVQVAKTLVERSVLRLA